MLIRSILVLTAACAGESLPARWRHTAAELDRAEAARAEAVRAAHRDRSLVPGDDPCPTPPGPLDAGGGYRELDVKIVRARDLADDYWVNTERARQMREHLRFYAKSPELRGAELERLEAQEVDAVLVADDWTEPTVDQRAMSYAGGRLRGVLYVWSYPAGRIVCVGPVDAALTGDVRVVHRSVGNSPRWALESEAYRRGREGLRAVR